MIIQNATSAATLPNTIENPTTLWGLYKTLMETSKTELTKLRSKETNGGLEPMLAQDLFRKVTARLGILGKYVKGRDIKEAVASTVRTLGGVLSVDVINDYPKETQNALMTIRGYLEMYEHQCEIYVESTEKKK